MPLPPDLPSWRSTLSAALTRAEALAAEHRLHMPTERLARDWRAADLLTKDGRQFTGRNILELLRIRQLREQDLPLPLIQQDLKTKTDEALWDALTGEAHSAPPLAGSEAFIDETARLLAAGLLRQFKNTQNGLIVGIISELPRELRQAQTWLARLALRAGEEDRFAAVHPLIHMCTRPMGEWAPAPLAHHPAYRDLVLVDPDYLVPTEECDALAAQGGRVDDLIESRLHRALMDALSTLPGDEQAGAYTLIRRFIAEQPLATAEELRTLLLDPHLNAPLKSLIHQCYEPVHPSERRGPLVVRCAYCRGPMHPDGRCRLASCRAAHRIPKAGPGVPADTARVARPELLRYWADPALEELRVYRELTDSGLRDVTLYPHLDRCDVSVGEHTGVDVKDHANPARLAKTLSDSIGGLSHYRRRILAVADRRAREDQYIDRLVENLSASTRRTLTVLSVTDTIALIKGAPNA
ncbi:hypothetical protein [Deinococcus sonorensis]|uniref:REase associating with pPIWI RE domain-containing protein n=2 Tax=Deinococcus sonorensis TaxID=309891 RepID=A0AAU7UGC3_9DEIO